MGQRRLWSPGTCLGVGTHGQAKAPPGKTTYSNGPHAAWGPHTTQAQEQGQRPGWGGQTGNSLSRSAVTQAPGNPDGWHFIPLLKSNIHKTEITKTRGTPYGLSCRPARGFWDGAAGSGDGSGGRLGQGWAADSELQGRQAWGPASSPPLAGTCAQGPGHQGEGELPGPGLMGALPERTAVLCWKRAGEQPVLLHYR